MKTFYTAFVILLFTSFSSVNATNHTNNGGSQTYILTYGDTLRIVNGIYNGSIATFSNGAVVIVSAGATFKPAINVPSGKIINYGTCEFGSLGTFSNFSFDNYNLVNIKGDLTLYDGSKQTWNNFTAAIIKVGDNFSMNNADFTNYSIITIGGSFSMFANGSNVTNRGELSISGDLNVNNGILTNQNRITTDDLNASGGQVINEGSISPKGNMTFSTDAHYTNQCLLVTGAGFTNYGNFTNNGLLWSGKSNNGNNDHFYNSGTFTNSAGAIVKVNRFTNYSTIAGAGSYFITGDSYTSGTVGRNGNTSDTIKVYDVTRSNSNRIFDTQWGTVHPNVVYRAFAQPDTNQVNYAGCSSYYRSNFASVLPVEWNYFEARLVQGQPVLAWSAQYEANMKFEIERSFDNAAFVTINTMLSNATKSYFYNDVSIEKNTTVYYRIKGISVNGAVKFTETKTIRIGGFASSLSVYPNPVHSVASVQYNSDKKQPLIIRVSNIAGQQLFLKNVAAVKGNNFFSLTETAQLKAGVYYVELINGTTGIVTERFVKN